MKSIRKLDIVEKIIPLITDLGWEYQRMSADGKDSFDKIEKLLMDMGTEVPEWGSNNALQ